MKSLTILLPSILVASLATSAAASPLRVTGQMGLTWDGTGPSPVHTFGIVEDGVPGDLGAVVGWQLGIRIVPTSGATGTVQFAAAELPAEVDYLFGSESFAIEFDMDISPAIFPTTEINTVTDFHSPFTGVFVPLGGASLFWVTFAASNDASGIFNIEILPMQDEFGSYWTANDDENTIYLFADLEGSNPLVVGSIEIVAPSASIPEPSTAALLVSCILLGLALRIVPFRRLVYPLGRRPATFGGRSTAPG